MATPNKPITLFFIAPIYARGEDLIGEKAVDDDGRPNMIRVARGERRRVKYEVAKDLIIARQAIDFDASNAKEKSEAETYVRERNRAETEAAEKATQSAEEETDLRAAFNQLKKEFEALKKKAA